MTEIYCRTCGSIQTLTRETVVSTKEGISGLAGLCEGCQKRTAYFELIAGGDGRWAHARLLEEVGCEQACFRLPVASLAALNQRVGRVVVGPIPDEFMNGEGNPHAVNAFDPGDFLPAFPRVRMQPGYVLDYVYGYDGRGGEPLLYAREESQPPLQTLEEYDQAFPQPTLQPLLGEEPTPSTARPYLHHMHFDDDALGYLEFAYFVMVARRFYLFWHSLYNSRVYPTYRSCTLSVGVLLNEATGVDSVPRKDPTPIVSLSQDGGTVRLLTTEMNRGVSYLHIDCRPPNELLGLHDTVIEQPTRRIHF